MPMLHHFPHPIPVGPKEGAFLWLLTSVLMVGPAERPRPRAGHFVFKDSSVPARGPHAFPRALWPADWPALSGHNQGEGRQSSPGLVGISYHLQENRLSGPSRLWSSANLQTSLLFVIPSLLFMLSIPQSGVESKAHHRPSPGPCILSVCPAAGAARSPGKPSVSCQGETWITES